MGFLCLNKVKRMILVIYQCLSKFLSPFSNNKFILTNQFIDLLKNYAQNVYEKCIVSSRQNCNELIMHHFYAPFIRRRERMALNHLHQWMCTSTNIYLRYCVMIKIKNISELFFEITTSILSDTSIWVIRLDFSERISKIAFINLSSLFIYLLFFPLFFNVVIVVVLISNVVHCAFPSMFAQEHILIIITRNTSEAFSRIVSTISYIIDVFEKKEQPSNATK